MPLSLPLPLKSIHVFLGEHLKTRLIYARLPARLHRQVRVGYSFS